MVKKKVWPEFLRQYYFKLYSRRHSLCLQKRELIFVYIFQFYHRGGFNYCVRNKKSLCYFINCTKELLHDRHLHHLDYLFCYVVFDEHRRWISGSLQVTCGHWMLLLVSASTEKEPFPEPCSSSLSCCWTRSKRFLFFFLVLLSLPWTQSQTFLLCIFSEPVLCNSSWHTPALLIIFGVVKCAVVNGPKLTVCPNRILQPMR